MRALLSIIAVLSAVTPLVAQDDDLFEVGENDFRISFQQGTGNPAFGARFPAVAYNFVANEYMVVWSGQFLNGSKFCQDPPIEREIWRQRLDASTGEPLGSAGIISRSGPTCNNLHVALEAAIAYNVTNNEYLVVWSGEDDADGQADDEIEIFGQLLDSVGTPIGPDDFRISETGGIGSSLDEAVSPAVAWNAIDNEYLVVWSGGPLASHEIFGQRIDSEGAVQGANDFHISKDRFDGKGFMAVHPDIAWNATNNEYLVVWSGDDDVGGLISEEYEIFGQLLDAMGGEIGEDDFRISDMGGTGEVLFDANAPAVAWNSTDNEYLIAWYGDDEDGQLFDGEFEIFGQLVDSGGGQVGSNDFRVSDLGGTGDAQFAAGLGDVLWNATAEEYLVIFAGDDNLDGLVVDEFEIFGQRLGPSGTEIGANDFRISDTGGTGNADFDAAFPAVAWNSTNNELLVVWQGDDNIGGPVNDELEIFGQRLAHALIFSDGFESGNTSGWSSTQ